VKIPSCAWLALPIRDANRPTFQRRPIEILSPQQDAWEGAGHRGAVLDALRTCLQEGWPPPDWLSQAIEKAVTWWARDAPTGKKGRHAHYKTARREAVQDLERYEFYTNVRRQLGLNDEGARAMTARWFFGDDPDEGHASTIRDSLRRAEKMPREAHYLALDDRHHTTRWLHQNEEIRRWVALWQEFRPRGTRPTT
jgi:hypothetical protein